MRIGMHAWGSEGDIRPLIALGGALSGRGHEVTLATTSVDNKDYSALCDRINIFNIRVPAHLKYDITNDPCIRNYANTNPLAYMRYMMSRCFTPYHDDFIETAEHLCAKNDAVIGHCLVYTLKAVAKKQGIPFISVVYNLDLIPTYDHIPGSGTDLGKLLNAFLWKLYLGFVDIVFRKKDVNNFLRSKGLTPARHILPDAMFSDILNLVAVSPFLGEKATDWRLCHKMCGFFQLPEQAETYEIPNTLQDFLTEGPAPVYMTFGSMQMCDPVRSMSLCIEAARKTGCRAIIQTSSLLYPENSRIGNIYFAGKVPHRTVFQRCSAVVHHGGAGTAHAAAQAGLPSVVVWFIDEQLWCARRLQEKGIAGKPLRYKGLTPEKLSQELKRTMSSLSIIERAREAGQYISYENGLTKAVDYIEELSKI